MLDCLVLILIICFTIIMSQEGSNVRRGCNTNTPPKEY